MNRDQRRLLVVLQDQGEDIGHPPITTRPTQHLILQLPERKRQLREGGAVAQRFKLALEDGQIGAPVVDRAGRQMMGALDQPFMLTEKLPFRGREEPITVDPQADRAVRKRCGKL